MDAGNRRRHLGGALASAALAVAACGGGGKPPTLAYDNLTTDGRPAFSLWGASASDVWESGGGVQKGPCDASSETAYLLHFDGASWTHATPPATATLMAGLTGSSASDVWSVGQVCDPVGHSFAASLFHFDGHAWSVAWQADATSAATLSGVAVAAPGDVWAAGVVDGSSAPPSSPLLLHATGPTWTPVQDAAIDASGLADVCASSSQDVWLFGVRQSPAGNDPALYHFDGSAWSSVAPPPHAIGIACRAGGLWVRAADSLYQRVDGSFQRLGDIPLDQGAVWVGSPSDIWAAVTVNGLGGDCSGGSLGVPGGCTHADFSVEHWNGSGWSKATARAGYSLVWSSGASDPVWFVGDTTDRIDAADRIAWP